ncbi:MAG: LLM class flavin-dependent oxidoreductase [Myxococcota bacterium]
MPLGFHFPFSTIDAKAQAELAQLLRDRGYGHVWTGENPGTNGFLPLALASQWAPGLGLASACFPVQTRGPGLFADTVAQLCASAPASPVIVGIGSSSEWVVQRMNGRPYGRPVESVRDMARFLSAALAGEDVRADNASFRVRYKLARPLARPPKLMVAALRPKMIEMGAAESDGVILNNVVPEDLAKIVPLVKRHGADKQIAARVYVTPVEDPTIVRQVGAASLAAYLGVPTYRKHQEWLGHSDLFAPLWEAWDQGGFAAARAAVTDTMVDHLYHHGSPEACRTLIRDYEAAGVDHVIVSPVEEALDPREIARRLAPQ